MNNPREDGLSSQEESGLLGDIEDALVAQISANHNSVYAGRLTSAGDRDLFFYFGNTTLYDKTISEVMVAYPKYNLILAQKKIKIGTDILTCSILRHNNIKASKIGV